MRKTRTTQTTIAIASLVSLLLIMNSIAIVGAVTGQTGPKAQGVGAFLHEHEGMICTHSFLFSVSNGISQADGWYYIPSEAFTLVCSNSTTVCMIIMSFEIARFRVVPVVGGMSVVFEGLAKVNMGNGWVEGWWFRATGFDYGSPGKNSDAFGLQLWDPDHWSETIPNLTLNPPEGQHSCEGNLIAGNIIIKTQ